MTSSSIRLVLADVDGTLVTNDKVLTDRAIEAVRKLGEAGILFAVTSGRPPRGMSMLIDPLNLSTPIAAFNGGLLVNRDMSVIEQRVLPEDLVKPVSELFGSFGLDTWVYQGADWYVPDPKGAHVAKETATVKFEPKIMTGLNGLTSDIAKLVGVGDDLEAVARASTAAHDKFLRDHPLLDHRHVPVHHDAAVKGGDRGREVERLDQHRHAARRPAAGDREQDPGLAQLAHGIHGPVGEDLVRCHQRAVDVGQDQFDAAVTAIQEVSPSPAPGCAPRTRSA